MKKIVELICIFLLFAYLPMSAFGDSTDWELKKNENSIAVYTRYPSGSNLKEVRVVNEVKSSLSGIVALLLDVKNYPNWIYGCSEASTLKVISDREQYQYQVTDVPWPVSDRDMSTHFKIEQDEKTKVVTIVNKAEPSYSDEKKDIVRVQHFQSSYKLTPIGNGKVKVEFELYVDPGGNIPAWIINSNIVTAPYKTTQSLIKELPKYQNSSVSFIKEP